MHKLLSLLVLVLLISSCQTTNHYVFIIVEKNATADITLDTQFSTQRTVTPTTDLEIPVSLVRELNKNLKVANRGIKPPDQKDIDDMPYVPAK